MYPRMRVLHNGAKGRLIAATAPWWGTAPLSHGCNGRLRMHHVAALCVAVGASGTHALACPVRGLSLRLTDEDEAAASQRFSVSFTAPGSACGVGGRAAAATSAVGDRIGSSCTLHEAHLLDHMVTAVEADRTGAPTALARDEPFGADRRGRALEEQARSRADAACTSPTPPLPLLEPRVHPPMEFAPPRAPRKPFKRLLFPARPASGAHADAAAPAPSQSPATQRGSAQLRETQAAYIGVLGNSFVNPFNGRLVRASHPTAKLLFSVGFYRGATNSLHLEWSPARYMLGLHTKVAAMQVAERRRGELSERRERRAAREAAAAAEAARKEAAAGGKAAAMRQQQRHLRLPRMRERKALMRPPAASAVELAKVTEAFMDEARTRLLLPLTRKGPKHWTHAVAQLLQRDDAFTCVNGELERLYAALSTAYVPPKLDSSTDPAVTEMTLTTDQQHVVQLAQRGFNLFVGGSAGTGKTVLLKRVFRELAQMGLRVAMTATTGVAAVQLGGCTFHHAFNAPLSATPHRWDSNALRAIDVVIIDEVSLLDACMLDAFDMEARLARMRCHPFGGLQLIVCGDFLQLSRDDTLPAYESAAFRHLLALRLVTPMRHSSDDDLGRLLDNLRHGRFEASLFRYLDRPIPADATHVTYIFPRRREALQLNERKLGELTTQEMTFTPQRGPLQLCGTFTASALVELQRGKDGMRAAMPPREQLMEVLLAEARRVLGRNGRSDDGVACAPLQLLDHEVVVMPVRAEGTLETRFVLRLRCREKEQAAAFAEEQSESSTDPPATPTSAAPSSADSTVCVARAFSCRRSVAAVTLRRRRRTVAPFSAAEWAEIAAGVAERLGGWLVAMLGEEPTSLIPLSVSMALADMTSADTATSLAPLRLKLGCRVMITRNLSRTVSNGSVGVVEAFAPPDSALFPRRSDRSMRIMLKRISRQRLFEQLPVVRLLSGEVVQVPPTSVVLGGTAQTYFYGHEVLTMPLQLGYAFTVHKVQGLTLQGTVVLDCEKFFDCAHLIYVACSRVRRLDQLVVYRVQPNMIIIRRSALEFSEALPDASSPAVLNTPPHQSRADWTNRRHPHVYSVAG